MPLVDLLADDYAMGILHRTSDQFAHGIPVQLLEVEQLMEYEYHGDHEDAHQHVLDPLSQEPPLPGYLGLHVYRLTVTVEYRRGTDLSSRRRLVRRPCADRAGPS